MKWVVKTSSVRVATRRGDRVYRSLEDVPPELRRRIQETIAGPDAETILIANPEAYERIIEDRGRLPGDAGRLMGPKIESEHSANASPRDISLNWRWIAFGGLGVIVGLWALWIRLIQIGM